MRGGGELMFALADKLKPVPMIKFCQGVRVAKLSFRSCVFREIFGLGCSIDRTFVITQGPIFGSNGEGYFDSSFMCHGSD